MSRFTIKDGLRTTAKIGAGATAAFTAAVGIPAALILAYRPTGDFLQNSGMKEATQDAIVDVAHMAGISADDPPEGIVGRTMMEHISPHMKYRIAQNPERDKVKKILVEHYGLGGNVALGRKVYMTNCPGPREEYGFEVYQHDKKKREFTYIGTICKKDGEFSMLRRVSKPSKTPPAVKP